MPEGEGTGHHGEAEGERDTDEADAQLHLVCVRADELRSQYGGTAAAEDQPEGAEEFGAELGAQRNLFHE